MACTWFGEISSCCSLTALPGPAWVLLSKTYKPFAGSLYLCMRMNAVPPFFALGPSQPGMLKQPERAPSIYHSLMYLRHFKDR